MLTKNAGIANAVCRGATDTRVHFPKKKKIVGRSYRGKIKKRRKERRKDGRKGEEGKTVRGKGEVALPASHLLAQRLGKQFAPLI